MVGRRASGGARVGGGGGGGKVQANFRLSFVCPMQAITYKCKQINC